jgi:pilus assembly protein Flp/PilA
MISRLFQDLLADETGATAIEYALLAALIAIACIVALQQLGNGIAVTFSTVAAEMGLANQP